RIPPQEAQIAEQFQSPAVRETLVKQAVQPLEGQRPGGALTGTPASTAKRADRSLAEPVNLKIGRVLKRVNVNDGYFAHQVFDEISGDDLSRSTQPPADPLGELDPERYVELEVNIAGRAVRLLKLTNARVNQQSIRAFDQDNQPIRVKRVTTDVFGLTTVEFNQETNGTIRFTIHPQKISIQPENQALVSHYQQSHLAEPLNLPPELRRIIDQGGSRQELATAIADYLSTHYTYDASSENERALRDSERSMVNAFFRLGRGDCEDFNLALATILRDLGIPCRVVEGYLYELNTGSYHRWVEVLLEDGTWQRFDATAAGPARAGNNSQEVRRNRYVPEIHDWPDTPETFWRLTARLESEFRELSVEREAVRNRLFEVGFVLGANYLDLAIDLFLADATSANIFSGGTLSMNFREWWGDQGQSNLSEANYEIVRAVVNQRIRGVLNDPSTHSNIRAGYMRAYNMTENVDTYYERGWLTPADYLQIRFHQAFGNYENISSRPLKDLINRPEIRSIANDPEFIRQFMGSHGGAGSVFYQNFLPFFFESLSRDNQVASTFNYLATNEIGDGSIQFMAYIAYRTGDPNLREQAQNIYQQAFAGERQEFQREMMHGREPGYSLYLDHTPQVMQDLFSQSGYGVASLGRVLLLFNPEVRQEIFGPYLNDYAQPLQAVLDNPPPSNDVYRSLLETALALLEIDPRFQPMAQIAAELYFENIESSNHNIFSLNFNLLNALGNRSSDGLAYQIVTALLRQTNFEEPWQISAYLDAIQGQHVDIRRLSPIGLQRYLEKSQIGFSLRLDRALVDSLSPAEIRSQILRQPTQLDYVASFHAELWPQIIIAELRLYLTIDEHGLISLGSPIPAEITQIFDQYSHTQARGSLTDLLCADLLAEERLPPATANLYLETLARTLEITAPTEGDFMILLEIERRYGRSITPAVFSPARAVEEDN
ncbi:MAG: hypothetical protein KJ811_04010, partial [Candidatus Margulisbacteria bacterium]|nr:hypothetical protein [Candidatus Margulisiibacteriota bacterium]